MSTNFGPRDDSTFKPDPPQKVSFYQVALLFVYHIFLAIFLGYAIYNVWPPQPWPGDSAQAKAEAKAEQVEAKKAAAAAQANSGAQNQNSSGPPSGGTNVNSASVANTNVAANTNAAARTNQNTNANANGSSANVNAGTDPDSAPAADSAEPSTAVYGGERPPPFWLFGKKFQPTLEVRLLLLVLLAGAIGSYIHASSSFVDYLGNRTLISSWVWWYLLRPFIGMMLALLFYFVFRGGFITAGVNQGGEAAASFINPFGIAALAGLVGMFSKVASDKLNEVFLTLFAPKAGQGDAKRGDKLIASIAPVVTAIAPNVGPAMGGTPITITGTDFLANAAVKFGGVAAPEVLFKDSTRLTSATPPHAAGIVDVEVINPNNLNAVLKGGFTYLADAAAGATDVTNAEAPTGSSAQNVAGAEADELDVHDVELKTDTADEHLPITEGGVE
jgi:hypothetical protein